MNKQNSFVTDAINLKSYSLSESAKIIVMYSRDKGLIRGVAKGVKKPKSKLGARMDLLVANKLMLHQGKNLNTISQAEAINTFNKTRRNMDKIFYSMYVSEVVNNFGVEDDPCSASIFDLLYEALQTISNAEDKVGILNAVIKFQLKMMRLSGFSLELDKCLSCGRAIEEENMMFSERMGGVVCNDCNEKYGLSKIMHHKLRDFLSVLANTELDEISEYEQKATEKICLVCFELLKSYINSHSAKKFKSTAILQEVV